MRNRVNEKRKQETSYMSLVPVEVDLNVKL